MKPRFTIRDLFWILLLFAVLLGWWLDHRKLTRPIGEPKMGVPLSQPVG